VGMVAYVLAAIPRSQWTKASRVSRRGWFGEKTG
jgi:hypothetical protein